MTGQIPITSSWSIALGLRTSKHFFKSEGPPELWAKIQPINTQTWRIPSWERENKPERKMVSWEIAYFLGSEKSTQTPRFLRLDVEINSFYGFHHLILSEQLLAPRRSRWRRCTWRVRSPPSPTSGERKFCVFVAFASASNNASWEWQGGCNIQMPLVLPCFSHLNRCLCELRIKASELYEGIVASPLQGHR